MQSDPEVSGVLYTGSLGRGTADRYSDLDINVWAGDRAFRRLDATTREVLALLGSVQFVYRRGPAFVTAFVGPHWQRVDLYLLASTNTKVHADYAGGHIVKDLDGALARIVAEARPEPANPSWDAARAEIEEAVDSLLYATLHDARGEHWSAAAEITGHAAALYTLLASVRGRLSHGFRYVDEILSEDERALLERTWPARPEQAEVRRATRALWDWLRHVWTEAERSLERPLGIEIDDHSLWEAIDAYYVASEGDRNV